MRKLLVATYAFILTLACILVMSLWTTTLNPTKKLPSDTNLYTNIDTITIRYEKYDHTIYLPAVTLRLHKESSPTSNNMLVIEILREQNGYAAY